MWTLARVAAVIEKLTMVSYSLTWTCVILHDRLGWSRQRPARAARERDEGAVTDWVAADCLRIKSARRRRAWICFTNKSGFSQVPAVRAI